MLQFMELERVRFDLATDQRKLLFLKQWLVNFVIVKIKKKNKVPPEVPIPYLSPAVSDSRF